MLNDIKRHKIVLHYFKIFVYESSWLKPRATKQTNLIRRFDFGLLKIVKQNPTHRQTESPISRIFFFFHNVKV